MSSLARLLDHQGDAVRGEWLRRATRDLVEEASELVLAEHVGAVLQALAASLRNATSQQAPPVRCDRSPARLSQWLTEYALLQTSVLDHAAAAGILVEPAEIGVVTRFFGEAITGVVDERSESGGRGPTVSPGGSNGVVMTGADVTEREKERRRVDVLTRQLRETQEWLRQVLDASGAAMWSVDVATWRVTSDVRLSMLLGVTGERLLIFADLLRVIHRDDRARMAAVMGSSLRDMHDGRCLVEFRTAADPARWIEGRLHVSFDAFDKVRTVSGMMIDVTARRHSEQGRARASEVERALRREAEISDRSKDEFLAMLSHELRNPLAPISTALQLMALHEETAFARERRIIERQVGQLTRLIDDLLDVSRITNGKLKLDREPVNLATTVASAIEIASPMLEIRQQHLSVAVPGDGLLVDGDPVRLTQVITNLLANAAKRTDVGGSIEIIGALDGAECVLLVRDTGIGIASHMLPRVFELFAQERPIDRAPVGMGLGLAIVRSLVTMHGGTISVRSDGFGRGSEFTIRLPVATLPASETRPAPPARRPSGGPARRILVVDDNVDASDLLASSLESLGHEVRAVYDGPSALKLVETFHPQVAVLDVGLPMMDGYELGRRLRAQPGLERVRLVALTWNGRASDRLRSTAAGFDAHLVKPLQLALLEALLVDEQADAPGDSSTS